MLQRLTIKNYALIDEVELEFGSGLTIITGETGAGKSIMLGALGLLQGNRADTKAIADRERKTIVEAIFMEEGKEIIVRREISPSGRSRAFVDDSPVTLGELTATTARLLDIHSQHASLSLNTPEGQRSIIDAVAGIESAAADYKVAFREFVAMRARLRSMQEEQKMLDMRKETVRDRLQRIVDLKLKPGEQREIERRFEILSDADEIRETLSGAYSLIDSEERGALDNIREACDMLDELDFNRISPDMPEEENPVARLRSLYIELKDVAESVARTMAGVESNPAMLAAVTERMRTIHEAVKEFHAGDAEELIKMKESLYAEYDRISANPGEIRVLETELKQRARELKVKADAMTEMRRKAALEFSETLTERAKPLGLPNLKFEVSVTTGKLTAEGQDTIEFLCRLNKNGELLPMATTASGGELSRLTLSIKSIMAERMNMPTVVFDEIDTGVSGEIADKMGAMMRRMAEGAQIVAITHLPQVAAKGERHFKVFKKDTDERTVSRVKPIEGEERVREIAAMMSGERLTEAALAASRELLESSNPK